MNEHVVLDRDGAALTVAGVTDWSQKSDPRAAAKGAPEHAPQVRLAHQPRSAPFAEAAGYRLRLLGTAHAFRRSFGDHAPSPDQGVTARGRGCAYAR